MQQWDEGMEAAELLVQWQRAFVGWWDDNVGGERHGSGQGKACLKNADRRSLIAKDKADADTKISQQQVSRWRSAISDTIMVLPVTQAYERKNQNKRDTNLPNVEGDEEVGVTSRS